MNLVTVDLSSVTVRVIDDKIKFIGSKYDDELDRIVSVIKKGDSEILDDEKKVIRQNIQNDYSTRLRQDKSIPSMVKARYKLIGYKAKTGYKTFLRNKISENSQISKDNIQPILLPSLLSTVFTNIDIGEELTFKYLDSNIVIGHFAGFRKNDLAITLPLEIRRLLGISNLKLYIANVDVNKRHVDFLDL